MQTFNLQIKYFVNFSREYTLFGSPEPSSSSRAFELFANRNRSPETQSSLSPIGTGIGRPILGRHHINYQEPTQPSYDLLSPRRLFPPDTAPTQEFAWPQRPALQRTSSWQTLSSVSEVPLVSKVLNKNDEILNIEIVFVIYVYFSFYRLQTDRQLPTYLCQDQTLHPDVEESVSETSLTFQSNFH